MTDDRLKTGGALDALNSARDNRIKELQGQVVSGYRIGELIGTGGMGLVFRATRAEGDFERVAAIKVVPTSLGKSEASQRFRTEVQILAKLNHPSIAQLYDAGETEQGWPYLVLEYVDGQPIDDYCSNQALSIEQRVRLMVDVSRVVRYAHARLIVHRDLKPSNVLVDKNGRVKLLDFGIAKLLEPGTPEHTIDQHPMTPQYASPEQLLGEDITIGSDIFQLGLLFLQMATGETPRTSTTLKDAIREAADGQDCAISDRIAGTLPPDLVAIVTRCLHADPDHRYLDVNALYNDLVSFQGGYPVDARRGNQLYRFRKLVQRNVPATAFAVLAALIAVGGTVYYTVNVSEARRVAEQRAETSNRVLTALSSLVTKTFEGFIDQNADRQTGTAAVVEAVLNDTVTVLREELDEEPAARSQLLQVEGSIQRALGDFPAAASAFDEALLLLGSHQDDPERLAETKLARAEVALKMNDFDASRELVNQVGDLHKSQALSDSGYIEYLHMVGYQALAENRYDDGLAALKDAVTREGATATPNQRRLAAIYETEMQIHQQANNYESVLVAAGNALDLIEQTESAFSSKRVGPLRISARAHVITGDLAKARAALEEAMSIAKGNFGDIHPLVANVHHTYGLLEYYSKNLRTAVGHVEEEIRIFRELYGPEYIQIDELTGNLAVLYTDIGEMELAADLLRKDRSRLDADALEDRHSLYSNFTNEARLRRAIGDYENAILFDKQSLVIRADLYGPDSLEVADSEDDIALALHSLGRFDEAREWFLRGADRYRVKYGENSEEYANKMQYYWRYDLVEDNLIAARDKLHILMMEDVEADEVDAIWPVHMFTDLAHINLQLKDMERAEQAIAWARTGADTAPRHPWAAYTDLVEAEIRLAQGKREEARELANRSIERMQDRFPMHTRRLDRARTVLTAVN